MTVKYIPMAITSPRGNNTHLFSRLKFLLNHQQRLAHAFSEAPQPRPKMVPEEGLIDMSKWRKVDSRVVGITRAMIPDSSYHVLRILREQGFEAYLVGGCVRDLILKRVPKDFDVITTANLKQIKRQFHRSRIVGQRFPICMVNFKGSCIEVSSFETVANNHSDKEDVSCSKIPKGCDKKDFIRWRNSMHRDFTINSLFFDPLSNKIYDYANGMADLKSLKLRSLVPAKLSFKEDCARILRGLRIAARLRLSISKETETAIHNCSSSILTLGTSRIMMEINYMLSYGAAEPSLCLLWRFNLLRLLLPFHAAYLDHQSTRKFPQNSTMLMKLFSNLDKVATVDRPSPCSLWVALLAIHMALVSHPQDALVVFTFASILYHGGCEQGVKSARDNAQVVVDYLPEISIPSASKSEEQLEKEVSQFASLVLDSTAALTATESLVERMSTYPESPCSGLVFVPKRTAHGVAEIFRVLVDDIKSYNTKRESYVIDYPSLQKGFLHETRFVLGKIILETMRSEILKGEEVVQEDYRYLDQESMKNKGKNFVLNPNTRDLKQESAKKHKLVENKCRILEEEKTEVVEILSPEAEAGLISVLEPVKKKHKSEINKCRILEEEKTEVVEILSPEAEAGLISVLGPVEKKHKSEINSLSKRKMHRKMEMEQQCIPLDKATKRQIKTVKNTLNQETLNVENILEDISEKLPADRQVREKENGGLSSVFSDEKIHRREQAADKGEKSSRPRLSSLFK